MEVRRLEVRNLVHKHMNEMPTMPKGGGIGGREDHLGTKAVHTLL